MNPIVIQSSLFLGIIPALLLLYLSIKGYEGLYKEKNIFLSFIGGIIAGVIAILIEWITVSVGVLFIILFPILEQLLKTMILNIGRLQNKKETVIYGLCLGLGFGSIFTPFSLITSNIIILDIFGISLIVIGSIGTILLQASTGIIIGYGVYTRKLRKYIPIAILIYIPVTAITWITILYRIDYLYLSLVFYGFVIYGYLLKNLLPRILPQQQRRKRLRLLQQK
ncbi:MAG: protease PrsW [Euryarchaeota archaeon]|nr:protease PrsW [Euryarchaeota archaeon]